MKVAHVNTSSGFSGGEVQVFLLLRGLREQGVESVLFSPPESASEKQAVREGFPTQQIRLRNDSDLAGIFRLSRAFSASGFDLAHLHSGRAIWCGSLAARLAGVPVVATKRMDRVIKRSPKSACIWRRWVNRAVAISPAVEQHFVDYGVDPARLRLIRSVVDPARVAPQGVALDARCKADPDLCTLLFAGSLHQRKGVDVLVDAMSHLIRSGTPLRAWILGEGPEAEPLQTRISEAGLEEHGLLLGRQTNVADYLAAADLFIMPSRAEGMGIAALEAMAAGVPVIASAVGGLCDSVVDGVTGRLVPSGDAVALAGAIRELAGDAERRRTMGEAARARMVERYRPDQMVAGYMALYRELVEAHGARAESRE